MCSDFFKSMLTQRNICTLSHTLIFHQIQILRLPRSGHKGQVQGENVWMEGSYFLSNCQRRHSCQTSVIYVIFDKVYSFKSRTFVSLSGCECNLWITQTQSTCAYDVLQQIDVEPGCQSECQSDKVMLWTSQPFIGTMSFSTWQLNNY